MILAPRCDLRPAASRRSAEPYGAFRSRGPATTRARPRRRVPPRRRRALRARRERRAQMIYGTPIEERDEGGELPAARLRVGALHGERARAPDHDGSSTTRARSGLSRPRAAGRGRAGRVDGVVHKGEGGRALRTSTTTASSAIYNIDGCSWAYDARVRRGRPALTLERVLWGRASSRRRAPWAPLRRGSGRFAAPSAPRPRRPSSTSSTRRDAGRRTRERALGLRRSCSRPARMRRSTRTTACASRPGSTCRPSASASRGRGRSSTTSTAARRARSGPTSPGSRCR